MIPYSVLDLSPIAEGSQAADAMHNTLALAQHAERLGYRRFWLAEHHNMPGIASAATAVLIGYVAQGTSTIRVGSGGIMLPNHSPLVVAEQFGTLAALYPGRIDLGLGRAPGSDQATARALRRHLDHDTADSFPQDVEELRAYFDDPRPGQRVRAVPGAGLKVPLWLLGSSLFSAQLSAAMGLPFAFASHFAPGFMRQAVDLYRRTFRPSEQLDRPHVMLGLNVFAGDTDDEARRLFSSLQQQFLALVRGAPGQLKPPVDDIDRLWDASEADHIRRSLACSVVGNPAAVREGIQRFVDDLRPDELMLTGQIYDHEARLHSFAIAADAMQSLQSRPSV
jgi:luciferase family oxidoreductase group 1